MPRGHQHRPSHRHSHRHSRRPAARRAPATTTALPAGETDSNSAWDATDEANILGGGACDIRKDTTLDGTVGAADVTHANSITGGYQTLGRGVLSSEGVQNRFGYAGYKYDPHLAGAGRHLYHVRNRVYMAHIGRWMTRDPLGYVDGMSLYEYVRSMAVIAADPSGLHAEAIPGPCVATASYVVVAVAQPRRPGHPAPARPKQLPPGWKLMDCGTPMLPAPPPRPALPPGKPATIPAKGPVTPGGGAPRTPGGGPRPSRVDPVQIPKTPGSDPVDYLKEWLKQNPAPDFIRAPEEESGGGGGGGRCYMEVAH